jgi:hypothetical protein
LSQGEGDLVYPKEQVTWLVTCQQPMTWYKKSKRYQRKKGPVPDAQLQPIRGVAPKTNRIQQRLKDNA